MDRDPTFISYGTKFEFNSRTDRIQQTKGYKSINKNSTVMIKDVPEIFSGTVEVDGTYLGGQEKNKRRFVRDQGSKRGRGTTKQPIFGILPRNSTVWAE